MRIGITPAGTQQRVLLAWGTNAAPHCTAHTLQPLTLPWPKLAGGAPRCCTYGSGCRTVLHSSAAQHGRSDPLTEQHPRGIYPFSQFQRTDVVLSLKGSTFSLYISQTHDRWNAICKRFPARFLLQACCISADGECSAKNACNSVISRLSLASVRERGRERLLLKRTE